MSQKHIKNMLVKYLEILGECENVIRWNDYRTSQNFLTYLKEDKLFRDDIKAINLKSNKKILINHLIGIKLYLEDHVKKIKYEYKQYLKNRTFDEFVIDYKNKQYIKNFSNFQNPYGFVDIDYEINSGSEDDFDDEL